MMMMTMTTTTMMVMVRWTASPHLTSPHPLLLSLQYVLGNCQGLGNAIVYGFDPAMLEQLRARILGMPGDADPGAPKPQESAVHLDSSIAMAVPDEPPTVVMERLGLSDGRNPDPDATEASVSPGSVHSMHSDSEPTSPNVGKGVG